MSAHVELDFHDDGTITMTSRPTKESAVRASNFAERWTEIVVAGGADNTVTHRIVVTGIGSSIIDGSTWAS